MSLLAIFPNPADFLPNSLQSDFLSVRNGPLQQSEKSTANKKIRMRNSRIKRIIAA